jgi:plastocyanin
MRTLLTCLLAISCAVSCADAAVRGMVHVPALEHDEPSFHPYAGHASSMPEHMRTARGAVTDAVLYLEGVPAALDSTLPMPGPRPQLAQKDQAFAPRVVAVPVGGTVDFPNLDPIYHNVFSVSPVRRFDLGKYPRGESRSVRFPRAGLVNVYCDIHSDMAGFILVVPNRVFARPRADGSWQLPDVPAGHYALCWWHPDFRAGRREIDVPADGDLVVDVGF